MLMDKTLSEERISSLKEEFSQGFIKTCGISLVSLEHGQAESRLEITGAHSQQDNFAHAGVMATMADHTAGYAAFSVVTKDYRILTLEFKINFLRPATGDGLACRARVVKEGKNILVADSEVFSQGNGEEKLVAKALVTLMAVPAKALRT
ncbi:MAG: PaaI family thioesterase [Syntrophobacterales bacterium]|jgi:uncharacterized protein (TIGR00369 family)